MGHSPKSKRKTQTSDHSSGESDNMEKGTDMQPSSGGGKFTGHPDEPDLEDLVSKTSVMFPIFQNRRFVRGVLACISILAVIVAWLIALFEIIHYDTSPAVIVLTIASTSGFIMVNLVYFSTESFDDDTIQGVSSSRGAMMANWEIWMIASFAWLSLPALVSIVIFAIEISDDVDISGMETPLLDQFGHKIEYQEAGTGDMIVAMHRHYVSVALFLSSLLQLLAGIGLFSARTMDMDPRTLEQRREDMLSAYS